MSRITNFATNLARQAQAFESTPSLANWYQKGKIPFKSITWGSVAGLATGCIVGNLLVYDLVQIRMETIKKMDTIKKGPSDLEVSVSLGALFAAVVCGARVGAVAGTIWPVATPILGGLYLVADCYVNGDFSTSK